MPDIEDPAAAENRQLQYLATTEAAAGLAHILGGARAELESLQHRPGAGVTGVFRVEPQAQGQRVSYAGVTSEKLSGQGQLTLPGPGGGFRVWPHPDDPALPGLPAATSPQQVARLWGEGSRLTGLETMSYRPLRRAVVAADFADGRRLYLKVLRRAVAAQLYARHQMLVSAGVPAPRPVSEPLQDVVVLEQGHGMSLAEEFLTDGAASVDPGEFLALLDALPAQAKDLPAREAWTDRLPAYAQAARAALPQAAGRINQVLEVVLAGLPHSDRGPVVPSHGDFYEANLLMQNHRISALLDVDSLGPGHRVDDLACFLGHVAVLPAVDARYVHVPAAFQRFAIAFAATVDPQSLRLRTAAVALSLVAGARDTKHSGWEAGADHRLRCAETILGLIPAAADCPSWPAAP